MHRAQGKHSGRSWRLAIGAAAVIAAGAAISSCVFASRTNFCESFGLRCKEGQECAANEAVCIEIGGCGNGIVDEAKGEVCDDGNTVDGEDSDAGIILDECSGDCKSNQKCGNGIKD